MADYIYRLTIYDSRINHYIVSCHFGAFVVKNLTSRQPMADYIRLVKAVDADSVYQSSSIQNS